MERILLVDDEASVLASLKRQLHKEPYEIYTAQNGTEGLDVVRKNGPFAVIVSDYRMPGSNGIEFLSQVKQICPDTSRIMLTGNTDLVVALDAINRGNLFRFLLKPVLPEVLRMTIEAGTDQYRLVTSERDLMEELMILQLIDRELNTNLDTERAMRITLEWALRRSGSAAGYVGTIEKNGIQIMTSCGYGNQLKPYVDTPFALESMPHWQRALDNNQPIQMQITPEHAGILSTAWSQILIPIWHEEAAIGVLLLENDKPELIGNEIISFLVRLCDHASIAIVNARLFMAAQAANLAKSEFVSFVSHELRNPLTSILGFSDMMNSGMTGTMSETQKNFVGNIVTNAKRMIALIADLSDVSRIESGYLRLDIGAVDLRITVEEAAAAQQVQIGNKSQTLRLELPADLVQVQADRVRLSQVVTNLISNANKYTENGGEIVLGVETTINSWDKKGAQQVAHIWVKDNGRGISAEDQKRIFQKFFRANDPSNFETPGTGLGLNITRLLVEMQGGRIWFESEYRKGTTFHFTVPLAEK